MGYRFACDSDGDNHEKITESVDQLHNQNNVKRAKGTYGGGDLLRPRDNSRSSASTNLHKASFLLAAIKPTVIGLLTITIFY